MRRIDMQRIISVVVAGIFIAAATPSWAQKAGQNVTIQYGTVTAAREVDLKSDAVPAGAVVGGALGLASGKGKSSSKKARNALVGAAAGGAIASASQGSQKGMLYDVDIGAGGKTQVVSDQREIRSGDCVAVERAGDTANLRRVSAAYCDKANASAITAVASEARKDADECASAKQQLVDATTIEQTDLASRKLELLCND
jgi:outer membrane lipoprotein SlyB